MNGSPTSRRLPATLVGLVGLVAASLATTPASAQEGEAAAGLEAQCYAAQELDKYRLLRRLSLDLRHQLPSYDEYLALDEEDSVPDALIDDWLGSEQFRRASRRFHEDLLWPNLSGVALTEVNGRIVQQANGETYALLGQQKKQAFRQGNGTQVCGDYEQVEFNPDGSPIPKLASMPGGGTYNQDGWVWVEPYWAPGTQIKVCAFDAQTAPKGQFADCDTPQMVGDPKCGCGPSLRRCYGQNIETDVWSTLREQLGRLVDDSTVGGRPYSEIVTSKRMHVNGRYEFWRKYMAPVVVISKTWNAPGPGDATLAEDPDWNDESWRVVERSGLHAGLQTLPAFLLRFQTNRARANRFRTVFTSQYFVPADGATSEGCSDDTTDLTNRCVCATCHQVLEPLAAHFAEFIEAGITPYDHEALPVTQEICNDIQSLPPQQRAGWGPTCNRLYVMEEGEPNRGTLLPWQYADIDDALHLSIAANIASGPGGLAESTIGSGLFHSSAVRNVFRALMGREMNLDPTDPLHELDLLSSIAAEFQVHDDFRQLVKDLIALPQYRRVR